MTFDPGELEALVDILRGVPGCITAAVVPGSASGDALIERLRQELPALPLEIASSGARPGQLGQRAEALGKGPGSVFVLPFDGHRHFRSDELVRFWTALNFWRESLASGTVRTFLVFDPQAELALAQLADDLWDWTKIFRFPEAVPPSELVDKNFEVLKRQWDRAKTLGLPAADLKVYADPLYDALARYRQLEDRLPGLEQIEELDPLRKLNDELEKFLGSRWCA